MIGYLTGEMYLENRISKKILFELNTGVKSCHLQSEATTAKSDIKLYIDVMLATFPKVFPKWPLPKGIFPGGNITNVEFSQ